MNIFNRKSQPDHTADTQPLQTPQAPTSNTNDYWIEQAELEQTGNRPKISFRVWRKK